MLNVLAPTHSGVIPTRDGAVEFGEKSGGGPLPSVDLVVELDDPQTYDDAGGLRTVRTGKACVPRAYDLRRGDWLPLREGRFGVMTDAVADFVHPLTGYDFGWKWFHIRMGG